MAFPVSVRRYDMPLGRAKLEVACLAAWVPVVGAVCLVACRGAVCLVAWGVVAAWVAWEVVAE